MSGAVHAFIPALDRRLAFPGELLKKLDGRALVVRAVDLALRAVGPDRVHVLTDSGEVGLACSRAGARVCEWAGLREPGGALEGLRACVRELGGACSAALLLSPYVPLLPPSLLARAMAGLDALDCDALVSAGRRHYLPFAPRMAPGDLLLDERREALLTHHGAFALVRAGALLAGSGEGGEPGEGEGLRVEPFLIPDTVTHIANRQDWWVCEKLLQRRRIVFHLLGYPEVGMGHAYRCLALAHEISDHEVTFVCGRRSALGAELVAAHDHAVEVVPEDRVLDRILEMEPDLVVNDVLNTDAAMVRALRAGGARVMNFEDLGSGAVEADLTVNELYDTPLLEGGRVLWGREYMFLRDEFMDARPRPVPERVGRLLVTFGGTDAGNLTLKTLRAVGGLCRERGIAVSIVTGPGYPHKDELARLAASPPYAGMVEFTAATGVISSIMERADVAVSANGRTVYELCHMRIPSVIVSQHAREKTHAFASEDNGFVHLGRYGAAVTEDDIAQAVTRLVDDHAYRAALHGRMARQDFTASKRRVVDMLLELARGGPRP